MRRKGFRGQRRVGSGIAFERKTGVYVRIVWTYLHTVPLVHGRFMYVSNPPSASPPPISIPHPS